MLNFDRKGSSFFAVLDGHDTNGHKVAEIVKQYLSSGPFLQALLKIDIKYNRIKSRTYNIDHRRIAYQNFFKIQFLRIDLSLNKDMAQRGGTTIVFLFVDARRIVVTGGVGDSSVFGVKSEYFDVEHLFKHHKPTDAS